MSESEDYVQPDFFRFGSDSLQLVREVINRSKFKDQTCRLLELGVGSGIIACEISQKMKLEQVILIEAQVDWRPYLEPNLKRFMNARNVMIAWETVGNFNLTSELQLDLIVCNPPYFDSKDGKQSPDMRRNVAHRFILDPWEEWLACIYRSLADGGEAWFLHKGLFRYINNFEIREGYTVTNETQIEDLYLSCLRRLNIK